MKTRRILEGSAIVLGVFAVWITQNTFLSNYSTYLLAILIIFSAIYISIRRHKMASALGVKKRSKSASEMLSGGPFELFTVIAIITFIIALTNGLFSPLFFFIYFILFLIAFLCEPTAVWIYLAAIILYFIPQAVQNLNAESLIKVGSLLLISPIAYFIGQELKRRQLLNRKIEAKTDEIIFDAKVLKEAGAQKSSDESEAIDEIIEEASSLKNDTED
jgi:hypothetical protein